MAVIVALAIGIGILALAMWAIRLLAMPPPPDPDPDAVMEVEETYRCSVCGMQLTVTYAPGEHFPAPRHCREDMQPV